MQLVNDDALPVMPVETLEFAQDPMPYVEAARRQHPWLAKFSSGYVVHGYQANKDLFFMDDNLHPGLGGVVEFYGAQGTMWARFMNEIVLTQSGPEHTRLRASVAQAFTPRRANQMRPLIQQVISDLLDEWVPRGAFDFAEFASLFPVAVICRLLGVSTEPIPRIRSALENQLASLNLNPALKPVFMAGFDVLWEFADGLVREREERGAAADGTLLDELIATKNAGNLDETELRFMVLTLIVAGYDTSKNGLTMTMYMMLERPEMWARCAEDKTFCTKVLEEMLRHSSIATTFRTVAKEFVYDGFRFSEGALVALSPPLAGRDPTVFPEPMHFDPERVHTNRHIAFGRGAHICLGLFIARAQFEEGLHLMAQRITNPRLAGDITWRPFLGVWGPRSLPIAFDPAPARPLATDTTDPQPAPKAEGCPVHQPV